MARRKRSRALLRKRSKRQQVTGRKPRSTIPRELRAPMTTEVEEQLRALTRRHGAKKVHEALEPLLAKCKLNDWLCVVSAVERLARKDSRAARWPTPPKGWHENGRKPSLLIASAMLPHFAEHPDLSRNAGSHVSRFGMGESRWLFAAVARG